MTTLEKCIKDCKHGIKALQNLKGSLEAFEKIQSSSVEDRLLSASLFHYAVIKYGKPFVATRDKTSKNNRYPISTISNCTGFNMPTHEILLTLRSGLIGHDDHTHVDPVLAIQSRTYEIGTKQVDAIYQLYLSNKCLHHTNSDLSSIDFISHIRAAISGVTANIENEFSKLRDHTYCDLAANSPKSPLHSTDLARSIKNFHEGDSAIPSQFSTANGYLFDEIQFTLTCNDFSVVEGSRFICSETVFF